MTNSIMGRGILAAACLFAFVLSASAQDNCCTVRGTARGPTGTPIPETTILAKNSQTGESQTANTNEQGQFELRPLTPGTYEFEVSRPGFLSQKRGALQLAGAQSVTLEFVLRPASEPAAAAAGDR